MVTINNNVLKSPIGILKLLTTLFGLLVTCIAGSVIKPSEPGCEFGTDRFSVMVAFGLLTTFWCFITFMLYLCDVTTRFEPGTMRTVELVGAAMLLLLSFLSLVFAANAASHYTKEYKKAQDAAAVTDPNIRKEANKELNLSSNLNAAIAGFIGLTMITSVAIAVMAYKCGVPGTPKLDAPPH